MGEPRTAPPAAAGQRPAAADAIEALKAKAPEVAEFLRLLANPSRLLLLCHLSRGERSVTEIQRDLGLKQPALSQQLAELRQAGLLQTRRQSRSIFYAIKDGRAAAVVGMLHRIFCEGGTAASEPAAGDGRQPTTGTASAGDAASFARVGPAGRGPSHAAAAPQPPRSRP